MISVSNIVGIHFALWPWPCWDVREHPKQRALRVCILILIVPYKSCEVFAKGKYTKPDLTKLLRSHTVDIKFINILLNTARVSEF